MSSGAAKRRKPVMKGCVNKSKEEILHKIQRCSPSILGLQERALTKSRKKVKRGEGSCYKILKGRNILEARGKGAGGEGGDGEIFNNRRKVLGKERCCSG